jgi:hypothetical protein
VCGEKVTKKDSFGCSYDFAVTWHTRCSSGPPSKSSSLRRRLSEREIFRGHGVNL